jgi:ferrous iron transport protein B
MKNRISETTPKSCCSPKSEIKNADSRHVMLIGNPNCGKSTLFNRLCNVHVRTGNYPGVTVSRHVGNYNNHIQIIDIPGIYSLTCSTAEEKIASAELLNNDAELIVNIVDATSLERSLYLTLELKMLGIPMVVLLNMWDSLKKENISIDVEKLQERLGLQVIPVSSTSGYGIDKLESILKISNWGNSSAKYIGSDNIANKLAELVKITPDSEKPRALFFAKSALQGDLLPDEILHNLEYNKKTDEIRDALSKGKNTIYETIAEDRYATINDILKECMTKITVNKLTFTENIDRIILNKYFAFPIFAVIMFLVYYISVTWLGAIVTDWTNDELFGNIIIPNVASFLEEISCPDKITSLITDGIIGGVGAVLGFVPQMVILFFLLSLLEECGYMTRAAFILDRVFGWFGLSGRAFIPYLIGSGCGVPALMTVRTLPSESERRLTLFTTTMIPCGAKLPVIIIFANYVFADSLPNFAPMMYLIAIGLVIISASMLRKFATFKAENSPLMLELPLYHMPSPRVVLYTVFHRSKSFIIKAGTIIFASVTVVWFLSSFAYTSQDGLHLTEEPAESILADVSRPISPLFVPLGFNDYRATVSIVSGLVAKENIISTMATISGMTEELDEDNSAMQQNFADTIKRDMFKDNLLAAFAFVIFNLFTLPCFAAMGVLRRELGSNKLFFGAVAYQMSFSYAIAMICYQFANMYVERSVSLLGGISIALVLLMVYLVFRKSKASVAQNIPFTFEK